jgi:hypothetical protein
VSSSAQNLDRLVYAALGLSAGTAETPYTKTFAKLPAEKGGFPCVKTGELRHTETSCFRDDRCGMNGKPVALYLRVSTGDQTIENQRQALTAACEARGWRIVEEFIDNGVSGGKGRDKRPGFDRLLRAATRRQIDVVAAWSVDRLGRSLQSRSSLAS